MINSSAMSLITFSIFTSVNKIQLDFPFVATASHKFNAYD